MRAFRSRYQLHCKPDDATVTIIEIRRPRNGWKCFEAPGVESVFLDQEQAIDYALAAHASENGGRQATDLISDRALEAPAQGRYHRESAKDAATSESRCLCRGVRRRQTPNSLRL